MQQKGKRTTVRQLSLRRLLTARSLLWAVSLLCTGQLAFSQTDQDLASAFYQGAANNCASVALIKAAMVRYGYNNMFQAVKQGDFYNITLQDGHKFSVSDDELQLAKSFSKFELTDSVNGFQRDSVVFYGYLAYACIAKYIQLYGYWECEEQRNLHVRAKGDFRKSLYFISRTSYCTDNCYKLLGLKIKEGKIFDYTNTSSLTDKGIILYSPAHAVAVVNNMIDCHGNWIPATTAKICYNEFKWFIILN